MTDRNRLEKLCQQIATRDSAFSLSRAAINATRLWNWADHQPDPEPLFAIIHDLLGHRADLHGFAYAEATPVKETQASN